MNKFVSNQETLEEAVDDLKLEIKEKIGNSIQNRNSKFEMVLCQKIRKILQGHPL